MIYTYLEKQRREKNLAAPKPPKSRGSSRGINQIAEKRLASAATGKPPVGKIWPLIPPHMPKDRGSAFFGRRQASRGSSRASSRMMEMKPQSQMNDYERVKLNYNKSNHLDIDQQVSILDSGPKKERNASHGPSTQSSTNLNQLKMKSQSTKNFHHNFKDLTPKYEHLRMLRGKKLGQELVKIIGKNLRGKVDAEARKKFNEFLDKGGRLDYGELRRLNSIHRKDYTRVILKEDSQIRQYVKKTMNNTNDKHDGLSKVIWDVEDVADTWDQAVNNIDDAVARKAKEARIDPGRLESKPDDDIILPPKMEECGNCDRDLKCRKHPIVRKNAWISENRAPVGVWKK